jgi:hypothetical protein
MGRRQRPDLRPARPLRFLGRDAPRRRRRRDRRRDAHARRVARGLPRHGGDVLRGHRRGADQRVPYWDDGTTLWDGGALWDQWLPLDLYVHLAGDVDPNGVAVIAILGFYFGAVGEVHPVLGPDKLTNGGFESLTGWTEVVAGAGNTTALDTALVIGRGSTSSLQLLSGGAAVGGSRRRQDVATVAGAIYRLSGYYRTDPRLRLRRATARLLIGDTAGTLMLYEDGRCADANGTVDMRETLGEWRRFLFDFIATAATTRIQLFNRVSGSPSAGQLNFDGVKLQRVYRYVHYAPRLTGDAFGDIEVGSTSIYFDVKPVGISNIGLINADGFLEATLGQLYTSNRVARVAVGGSLSTTSRRSIRDHWRDMFYGLSRGDLWVTDERVDIGLEDPIAQILDTEIPTKRYTLAEFPNMDLNREGYSQPIVLGNFIQSGIVTKDAVFMNRIDLTAAGYGVYHLADTTNAPDGLSANTPVVYQYLPGHADILHGYPIRLLASGTHYSWDRTTGRLTVLRDLRTYRFDQAGNAFGYYNLDFNIGAGTLTAGASADDSEQQATDLTTSWTAAAGVAVTWTYSTVTHKFTVTKAAGTLNLLCKTGNPLSKGVWERLGFRTDADRTGALTYTADIAVFTSPENDHLMAAMIEGIRDDAAGTYTGTPGATIIRPAEMFYFILRAFLGQAVDLTSILTARNLSNIAIQECREYLGSPVKIRDLFARLAASGDRRHHRRRLGRLVLPALQHRGADPRRLLRSRLHQLSIRPPAVRRLQGGRARVRTAAADRGPAEEGLHARPERRDEARPL